MYVDVNEVCLIRFRKCSFGTTERAFCSDCWRDTHRKLPSEEDVHNDPPLTFTPLLHQVAKFILIAISQTAKLQGTVVLW